jgi:hypothetical protein
MLVTRLARLTFAASKVADHILRQAAIDGRENVVAEADCGLCGRVHADLMQGVVLSEN